MVERLAYIQKVKSSILLFPTKYNILMLPVLHTLDLVVSSGQQQKTICFQARALGMSCW